MPMIRALRLLNAIEAGTTTGAQLETLLSSDPGRAAEFGVLCGIRAQVRRMLAAATTMTAIFGSSTATGVFAGNPTSLLLAVQDATYGLMLVSSTAAKMGIFNSDSALSALASSPTALSLFRTSSQYVVRTSNVVGPTAITSPSAPVVGGSYIVLGFSSSNAQLAQTITLATLRAGSNVSPTVAADNLGSSGTAGAYYPRAIPLVSPFTATMSIARTWNYGMLRCDV